MYQSPKRTYIYANRKSRVYRTPLSLLPSPLPLTTTNPPSSQPPPLLRRRPPTNPRRQNLPRALLRLHLLLLLHNLLLLHQRNRKRHAQHQEPGREHPQPFAAPPGAGLCGAGGGGEEGGEGAAGGGGDDVAEGEESRWGRGVSG